jgi:hypothetical protein
MEIQGSCITAEIRKLYKWVYVPRLDKKYFVPTRDFMMHQIIFYSQNQFKWRLDSCDCDDLALILCGKVKEVQCAENWKFAVPFGVSIGKLSDGQMHMTNCFYSEKGFEFYDSQKFDLTGFKPSMIMM